MTEQSFCVR